MHRHRIATILCGTWDDILNRPGFRSPVESHKFRFRRLLCWLGFHNFRVVDRAFEFGAGGAIEKVECRRCGVTMTRQT